MPFDWKTPWGYPLAWIVQASGIYAEAMSSTPFVGSIIAFCWLFISTAKDIVSDLEVLNHVENSREGRIEAVRKFCDIIHVYTDAKELSVQKRLKEKFHPSYIRKFAIVFFQIGQRI